MPVPKTSSVGKLIRFFRKDKPQWEMKQVIAAAMNTARKHGNKKVKKYPKK